MEITNIFPNDIWNLIIDILDLEPLKEVRCVSIPFPPELLSKFINGDPSIYRSLSLTSRRVNQSPVSSLELRDYILASRSTQKISVYLLPDLTASDTSICHFYIRRRRFLPTGSPQSFRRDCWNRLTNRWIDIDLVTIYQILKRRESCIKFGPSTKRGLIISRKNIRRIKILLIASLRPISRR